VTKEKYQILRMEEQLECFLRVLNKTGVNLHSLTIDQVASCVNRATQSSVEAEEKKRIQQPDVHLWIDVIDVIRDWLALQPFAQPDTEILEYNVTPPISAVLERYFNGDKRYYLCLNISDKEDALVTTAKHVLLVFLKSVLKIHMLPFKIKHILLADQNSSIMLFTMGKIPFWRLRSSMPNSIVKTNFLW
jgi:hypothetical protein